MSKIEWVVPPAVLQRNIELYGQRVLTAVTALAEQLAARAQSEMRQNAKWKDRTGNARSGLFSMAERAAQDTVVLYFSHGHTVDYGAYLELSYGQRYAIIAPTMQRMYPEVVRLLNRLLA